ncbi:MAG: ActS/PrrB/RegB family redox-sensitive histidine kinase [Pseudomonadota bacterium]
MLNVFKSSAPRAFDDTDLLFDGAGGVGLRQSVTAGVVPNTLLNLRWLAILGQVAAVAFVHGFLRFELPLLPISLGIATAALVNVALYFLFRRRVRLNSWQAGLQLVFDQLHLSYLLYFTGGLQNPFAVMMLLPLTISATMLNGRATVFMLALAAACLLFLTRVHLPLPWAADEAIFLPPTYLLGLWAGISISMVFVAAYAYRVSADARKRAQAVVALQAALSREQRLSAVDGLAAAAAHELGTPLGTIALVSKDLQAQLEDYPELADDFKLIESESQRCRAILTDISRRSNANEAHFARMPIAAIIKEIAETYQDRGVELKLTVSPMPGAEVRSPVVARAAELRHGVANFIANAVRFAAGTVEVDVSWDATHIHVVISDDGPGFSDDVLPRLGAPFVGSQAGRDGERGMGLGVFIATTLLNRTGAEIIFENEQDGGAVVDISWDRQTVEEKGETWDTHEQHGQQR